jgi:hypothetical protein
VGEKDSAEAPVESPVGGEQPNGRSTGDSAPLLPDLAGAVPLLTIF